jgi:uncharacterized protein YidB (DUF937 family)
MVDVGVRDPMSEPCRGLAPRLESASWKENDMGLLDGIIGGAIGVEIATLINGYIEKRGGLQGVLDEFEKSGYGDKVKSWVGTGPNLPISADQIQQTLGSDRVKELGAKFGIPVDKVAASLAEYLPKVVDKATPEGKLPTKQ